MNQPLALPRTSEKAVPNLAVDYYYDKIVRANRVPIDDENELIDRILEGVPDANLRRLGEMQCFNKAETLLRAFERMKLPSDNSGTVQRFGGKRPKESTQGEENRRVNGTATMEKKDVKKCYNCGEGGHISVRCPTKNLGFKCYRCGEHGHKASECATHKSAVDIDTDRDSVKDVCMVTRSPSRKCCKSVRIGDDDVMALVDTGSDLSLIKAERYIKIGAPRLQRSNVTFRGIGSSCNETLGVFKARVEIDGISHVLALYVVSDVLLKYDLSIGADFLNTVNVEIKEGEVSITKVVPEIPVKSNLSELCRVKYEMSCNQVDLVYVRDVHIKKQNKRLVDNDVAKETRDVGCKITHVNEFSRRPLSSYLLVDDNSSNKTVKFKGVLREDRRSQGTFDSVEYGEANDYVVEEGLVSKIIKDETEVAVRMEPTKNRKKRYRKDKKRKSRTKRMRR